MQTVPYQVERLITMAKSGQLVIPEFQRPFVWNEGQVRKLIDSTARAYPIGSILLLRRSEETNFAHRRIDTAEFPQVEDDEAKVVPGDDAEMYYILDGQQRITSLIRVFSNAHPRGTYYLDLVELYKAFQSESSDESGEYTKWFVFDRARGKHPKERPGLRYLKTKKVLSARESAILVDEFFDEDETQKFAVPAERRQAKAVVNSVFETIRNFKVPAVIMDQKSSLEAICRVFETINSTGTRLTTFDLATAKFYPSPNLRELWNTARAQFPLLDRLEISGERVLQIIALWLSQLHGKRAEPSRAVLLQMSKQGIQEHWQEAVKALASVCEWIERRGISGPRSLSSEAILVPLAAARSPYFQELIGRKAQPSFADHLERWFWLSALSKTFDSATNERIIVEFDRLLDTLKNDQLVFTQPLSLAPQALIGMRATRDSRARALQAFVLAQHPKDLMTGNDISASADTESHHIFPRAQLKEHPHVDSVVNRIWILRETNRKLSAKDPSDYIMERLEAGKKNGTEDVVRARLREQCIPAQAFERQSRPLKERFESFLLDRGRMLLDRLVEKIGRNYIAVSDGVVDGGDDDGGWDEDME